MTRPPAASFVVPSDSDAWRGDFGGLVAFAACRASELREVLIRERPTKVRLDPLLADLARALAWVAEQAGGEFESARSEPTRIEPVQPERAELVHDQFFGVRRENLSPSQWLRERTSLYADLVGELRHALVDRSTLLAVSEFIVHDLDSQRSEFDAHPATPKLIGGEAPSASTPLAIWKRAHHFLATACSYATFQLGGLQDAVHRCDTNTAADLARAATIAINAISATYLIAGEFSGQTYRSEVRPRMAPPHLPIELNGRYNIEYKVYRAAWGWTKDAMLDTVDPDNVDIELARALEDLFMANLMEAHVHIWSAWRLVGADSALHQEPGAVENAVLALYETLLPRLNSYRQYWRLPLVASSS